MWDSTALGDAMKVIISEVLHAAALREAHWKAV